jgi:hypothetical protein
VPDEVDQARGHVGAAVRGVLEPPLPDERSLADERLGVQAREGRAVPEPGRQQVLDPGRDRAQDAGHRRVTPRRLGRTDEDPEAVG